MHRTDLTVRGLTMKALRRRGFDGLYGDHCSCELDDLMPCKLEAALATASGQPIDCHPGYRTPALGEPGMVFVGGDAGRTPIRAPHKPHPDPTLSATTRHGRPRGEDGYRLPACDGDRRQALAAGRTETWQESLAKWRLGALKGHQSGGGE